MTWLPEDTGVGGDLTRGRSRATRTRSNKVRGVSDPSRRAVKRRTFGGRGRAPWPPSYRGRAIAP